jgi:hypothetical protein
MVTRMAIPSQLTKDLLTFEVSWERPMLSVSPPTFYSKPLMCEDSGFLTAVLPRPASELPFPVHSEKNASPSPGSGPAPPAAQRSEDEQSRGRTHSTQGPPQHLAGPRRGSATPAEISPFPETPGVVLRLLQSGDTERPRLGNLGLLPRA